MHIQGVKILYNAKVQSMLKKDSEIEGTVSLISFPYSGLHVLICITILLCR
jgi:hypothetical protein